MNKDFTQYSGWMRNAPFAERQRKQANLETLCGESGVTLRGMDVYNHNGDYISSLLNHEFEFVQNHRCTSDCRREGCQR